MDIYRPLLSFGILCHSTIFSKIPHQHHHFDKKKHLAEITNPTFFAADLPLSKWDYWHLSFCGCIYDFQHFHLIGTLIILAAAISRETSLLFPAWPVKNTKVKKNPLNEFFFKEVKRICLGETVWRSRRSRSSAIVGERVTVCPLPDPTMYADRLTHRASCPSKPWAT